jgi:hypothetical protein
MTDQPNQLRERVDQLRHRLDVEPEVSCELRKVMLELLDDLHERLASSSSTVTSTSSSDSDSLVDRMLAAGQRFESSHPVLAETIGNLADGLSRMGI